MSEVTVTEYGPVRVVRNDRPYASFPGPDMWPILVTADPGTSDGRMITLTALAAEEAWGMTPGGMPPELRASLDRATRYEPVRDLLVARPGGKLYSRSRQSTEREA